MPTTGLAPLPDVGKLAYNGITFNSLYRSSVSGGVVQDEARRTTKYMEWTLEVEGTVTLEQGQSNTDTTWNAIRKALTVHGAPLTYSGNGFGGLNINQPGGGLRDVAWGPVPKILYFRTNGAGRSAEIRWQVMVRIPEVTIAPSKKGPIGGGVGILQQPVQFNWESSIKYDDKGYSGLSIKGTIEIPMTRLAVNNRTLSDIVDNYRQTWLDIQIDLTNFRVTNRSLQYSRDKRTCEWEVTAEELPPMGLPVGATDARGTMSVRPIKKTGGGPLNGVLWLVSLRATYTIRKDQPARLAAEAFYGLLWFRMHSSVNGVIPPWQEPDNRDQQRANLITWLIPPLRDLQINNQLPTFINNLFGRQENKKKDPKKERVPFLTDFSFDEGLYLDSKTITFQASWFLATTFRTLLAASGVWRWGGEVGGNAWVQSVQNISGWRSWLMNKMDPKVDVIVDMGGGEPPGGPPVP